MRLIFAVFVLSLSCVAQIEVSQTIRMNGPAASRPAAGSPSRMYVANDTGAVFMDTGSTWWQIYPPRFADAEGTVSSGQMASHTHSGADLTSGTVPDARLSANVSLLGPTISGSELGNPAVGTKGGVEALTCSGTDKLSAIGTNGVPVCSADQGGSGSGVPRTEILLMATTQTFTNLGAAFVESTSLQSRTKFDFTGFTQVRVLTYQDAVVAAATGDLLVQCDTVSNFASPTTLASLDNVMAARDFVAGNWVNISGECANADVFLRSGMSGGNTTEDPVLRSVRIQVR